MPSNTLLNSHHLHFSPPTQVTSEAYSSPSIVLAATQHDGSRIIFDDFREAYYWLRQNTPENAKVMSWWDYGYQITAMANRTILVDNNTWNNTHISRVGQAMSSPEDRAYEIMRELDVDYVLVIFGGLTGYASDGNTYTPISRKYRITAYFCGPENIAYFLIIKNRIITILYKSNQGNCRDNPYSSVSSGVGRKETGLKYDQTFYVDL